VKHNQEIDMFPRFSEVVLNYIQFSPVNWHDEDGKIFQITNAGSIWQNVLNGPEKKYPNKKGKHGYPTKKSHNLAFKEFDDLSKGFNADLQTLIQKINDTANHILNDKLFYNITFHLELVISEKAILTDANYVPPKYNIKLIIDDFDGKGPIIIKPQSFLNEARLSAISLSIRLAILEQRLQSSAIKILVLDDLMISLDMSNRDKVSSLILNE
jgi:hypothetical protein